MKFKIYFTVGDYEDYVIIEGDTIDDIRDKADRFAESRNLDVKKNNFHSVEIK
jgi:hypothetical protein